MTVEILSTGWYCSNEQPEWTAYGDKSIRGVEFRKLWWHSIENYISPRKVLVVDSASPIIPNDKQHTSIPIEWLKLSINPGHAQNVKYHYSGWMASVILGMEYTLVNNIDYFLYIEQDVLVYGKKFIEQIEKKLLKNSFIFGSGKDTPQPLQQSVFAIRKDAIKKFIINLHGINESDKIISPEMKFEISSNNFLLYNIEKFFFRKIITRIIKSKYSILPFGYGRTRPIDFTDNCFYFQHGNLKELQQYKKLIGIT